MEFHPTSPASKNLIQTFENFELNLLGKGYESDCVIQEPLLESNDFIDCSFCERQEKFPPVTKFKVALLSNRSINRWRQKVGVFLESYRQMNPFPAIGVQTE